MMGIYKITNLVNGKLYVGSATNLRKRIKSDHIRELRNNRHINKHLQNSWNKYGENNFEFEVIEEIQDKNKLIEREQYWIDQYDFEKELYNQCPIANSSLGYKHTEESIIKMSKAKKGKNNRLYGKTRTEKTKQAISDGRNDKKSVVQIDKHTNLIINKYISISDASRKTKICQSNISSVCLKKRVGKYIRKTAGGYKWCFAEDYPDNFDKNKTDNSHPHLKKKVAQIDKDGKEIIHIFSSISDAFRKTGIATTNISRVCKQTIRYINGKPYCQKTAGGYIWKYID